ncbi:MAG: hypothetical protein AAF443_06400 [Chlamydiota bacterium]
MRKRNNNQLAEESLKTKKIRDKLKRRFALLEKEMTPQALRQKSIEIHRWIARHAAERVVLKSKSISLFDENQNTAKLSHKIHLFTQNLANQKFDDVRELSSRSKG